jgi:hypothetical protein
VVFERAFELGAYPSSESGVADHDHGFQRVPEAAKVLLL